MVDIKIVLLGTEVEKNLYNTRKSINSNTSVIMCIVYVLILTTKHPRVGNETLCFKLEQVIFFKNRPFSNAKVKIQQFLVSVPSDVFCELKVKC